MRKNGFSRPLHSYQVIFWILLAVQLTLNEVSLIPVLPLAIKIIYLIFYHISFLSVLYFGFKTTASNPTDPFSLFGLVQTKRNSAYCALCKSSVSLKSKHCMQCDRCVSGFDHHCKWVNNCIGKTNYRNFILSLSCLALNSLLTFGFALVFFVDFFIDRYFLKVQIEMRVNKSQNQYAWMTEMVMILVYSLTALAFSTYLLLFHYRLSVAGLTTYEFILNNRVNNDTRTKPENKNEIKSQSFQDITIIQ